MPLTPQKIVGEKYFRHRPRSTSTHTRRSKDHAAPKTIAPKTTDEINTVPMQEGDQFVDFKAFKAAMQDWAMGGVHKFNFRYKSQILQAI